MCQYRISQSPEANSMYLLGVQFTVSSVRYAKKKLEAKLLHQNIVSNQLASRIYFQLAVPKNFIPPKINKNKKQINTNKCMAKRFFTKFFLRRELFLCLIANYHENRTGQ